MTEHRAKKQKIEKVGPTDKASTQVYIVLTPAVLLLDLAAFAEPLRLANRFAREGGAIVPPFVIHMVACDESVPSSLPLALSGLAPLPTVLNKSLSQSCDANWVVLIGTATHHDVPPVTMARTRMASLEWLQAVVAPALKNDQARLWTVCSGALLAADAGLLDGRQCTTHHALITDLQIAHPRALVQDNRIFVIDGNVATSAGITAGCDLALAAISQRCGVQIASQVARDMVLYWRRAGADPQLSALVAHRNHLHPMVHRAQDAVLAEPAANWDIDVLAAQVHISARHLRRLFVQHAGCAPLTYVNSVRVALARQLLQNLRISVEQAATRVGFHSASQLRYAWKAVSDDLPRGLKVA
jgi:transcriptional regulator GlxA family with amidase domain